MIDLRKLKYFVEVATEGNIGRAALKLNISQPPLTRQIQQLEEDLDVSLFERTPKGMTLTPAGQLFLTEARNILGLVDLATERTQRAGAGQLGRLDIAIFGTAILDVIPQVLLRYRDLYPDVNVVLHTMDKKEQIEALRQRRISVGFNRILAPLPDMESEPLLTEPLLLAINTNLGHPPNAPFDFQALQHMDLILYPAQTPSSFGGRVLELCRQAGFEPNVAQAVGDAVTGVALVASGFGVCLVPECATTLKLPGVRYVELINTPPHTSVDLSCIYRADDQSPILQGLLGVVREVRGLRTGDHTAHSAS